MPEYPTPPTFRLLDCAEAILAIMVLFATLCAGPLRAEAPLDRVMAAVFTVHTADDENRFLGSAFLWGVGDVAVTNAHVVGAAATVRLTDVQGNQQIATVIAADSSRDVAVIAVTPGRVGLTPSTDAPRLGAEVWALGAPLGAVFSVTEGRISALSRQVEAAVPLRLIQHDAAINPGSSGGPLVDNSGALIGMNARIADGSRMFVGIAYAITSADLTRVVAGLRDGSLAPLPKLGLIARAVDLQLATALGIPASGLLVDRVVQGDLADRAGLQAGDVVLALNETRLAQPGDMAFAAEAAQTSGRLDFTVLRAGAALVLITDPAALLQTGLTARHAVAAPTRIASYTFAGLGISVDASGAIVALGENTPARNAGVAIGDRIILLNGQPVQAIDVFNARFAKPVLMLVQGVDGASRHVLIDPWATGKGIRPVGGANVLDPDVVLF